MPNPNESYTDWLLSHAMLEAVKPILARYSGTGEMWRRPYAQPRPQDAAGLASVWFTAYPPAIVCREGDSPLATLGDPALWQSFARIGIQGMHTGPMKVSGGVTGREFTPTIDGYFDRIGVEIDPTFGSTAEYIQMRESAAAQGAVLIDDIIPSHTGKGADFRLAERAVGDYPGLYHLVEIARDDWPLLPPVPEGADCVNLSPATVEALAGKGYLAGNLPRTIFYEPGVKESDWSATAVVVGADRVERRWVYLHYFKAGQPSLNWLDPTFAAQRLILGDALHALGVLGAGMLRLDANGFLGIERRADGTVWSEGHPLSVTGNALIAGVVRKAGGFTFQELNLAVDDIAAMAETGPDLSYDFITRPAVQHALITGDTAFLRLMLAEMKEQRIEPGSLIHALQNHDELTLELVHFWFVHKDDRYTCFGKEWSGAELRGHIRAQMYSRLTGPAAPYNRRFVENGVACTTASICAAALGISDLTSLSAEQIAQIQRLHLLLAAYNALQPGVFALSGWDLVGALPLPWAAVAHLADGDARWINRGGYDLMDVNPTVTHSNGGLPKATALYGSLPDQLARPDSFASQLQEMLALRQESQLFRARQVAVPECNNPALLVMVHELPDDGGVQVTALNFGPDAVEERAAIPAVGPVTDMRTGEAVGLVEDGQLAVALNGYGWRSYQIPV